MAGVCVKPDNLDSPMNSCFEKLDTGLDHQLDKCNTQFHKIDSQLGKVESYVEKMEVRLLEVPTVCSEFLTIHFLLKVRAYLVEHHLSLSLLSSVSVCLGNFTNL